MPTFFYKAISRDGSTIEGKYEASDDASVIHYLQANGLIPVKVSNRESFSLSFLRRSGNQGHLSSKQLSTFSRQLLTLIQAGLPLDRAMTVMMELNAHDTEARDLIAGLLEKVKSGVQLSEALEAQGGFSRFYVNMIRAGEAGGALDVVLLRLNHYLDSSTELRNTVVTALIYPALLLGLAVVSLMVLLTFVVPQFSEMFENSGKELPLSTVIVVTMADFARSYWWSLVPLALGLYYWIESIRKDPERKKRWESKAQKLPLIGDLQIKVQVANFSRTLSTLLNNGVSLLPSIAIVQETLPDTLLADLLKEVSASVKTGGGLTKPLAQSGFFPRLAMQMIRLGEESAQLPEMLEKVATIYDAEVKTSVQRLLAILEPTLIIGLGIMIGGIIVSMLMAILSLNDLAI